MQVYAYIWHTRNVDSKDHPIRRIKALADEALGRLHHTFEAMYSQAGRPSIPPERLLKAQILIAAVLLRTRVLQHPSRHRARFHLARNAAVGAMVSSGSVVSKKGYCVWACGLTQAQSFPHVHLPPLSQGHFALPHLGTIHALTPSPTPPSSQQEPCHGRSEMRFVV